MVVEIKSEHRDRALAYLREDPIRNVYLIGRLLEVDRGGAMDPTYAHYDGAGMDGLFSLGGILLLKSQGAEAHGAFAQVAQAYDLRGYVIIGERRDLAGFWEKYRRGGEKARLFLDQRFYRLDAGAVPEPPGTVGLAPDDLDLARLEDLEAVFEAHAAAVLEETGQDVLKHHPEETRERVAQNIAQGRVHLIKRDGELAFKAEVGTWTPDAATIVGVYTPPRHRGQGLATRGMAQLCRRELRQVPNLCLCVNEGNDPAIRVYEKLGFRRDADFLAIFLED